MTSFRTNSVIALLAFAAVGISQVPAISQTAAQTAGTTRLVTGKSVTPLGIHTQVGSYPQSGILSADGKYFLVSDSGQREYLSSIRVSDGTLISQIDYNETSGGRRGESRSLYFGLAVSGSTIYASGGAGGTVDVLNIDGDGKLTDTGTKLSVPDLPHPVFAGLALSSDGKQLYAADNRADPGTSMEGTLVVFDVMSGSVKSRVDVPGYPYAVAAITKGTETDKKVYVTSEQRANVTVVDPGFGKVIDTIKTGTQPVGLLLNSDQSCLYVANAGSDTVSVINTSSDKVVGTVLLRPATARALPGATPIGLSLSPDERKLYVSLADMNSIAVIDVKKQTVIGYLPTGWYPTGVAASRDGSSLLVAEARGVVVRNPNHVMGQMGTHGRGPLSTLQGVVSKIDLTGIDLAAESRTVYANNLDPIQAGEKLSNPGIKHVIYIIKENRTYDQILGDDPKGNGDPTICMFPKNVTPNMHALADRFVLLDNFYCCAEVSGDGWNWSTAGMASEYVSRNVPYSYGGRGRSYDYEGTNNGVAVDLNGIPDAAAPPGGYIWDNCARHHVSQRNYGFFSYDLDPPRSDTELATPGPGTGESKTKLTAFDVVTKKTLQAASDHNFRGFDLTFHDSDGWVKDALPLPDGDKATYGGFREPSRYSEWKREFDGYVTGNSLPQFSMIRLICDHTGGTRGGGESPTSQVADNDYSVGELVDAVSKSPYWKSTLIVVVEDDAQSGYDHVDCHRSPALFISPYIERGAHDSRFYNTDSALKTIEEMLSLPPMSQYDMIAAPINDFTSTPDNAEPYDAILPDKSIIGQRNSSDEYGAAWSKYNIDLYDERSEPDILLNEVLWRSIMHTTPPAIHHGVQLGPSGADTDDGG